MAEPTNQTPQTVEPQQGAQSVEGTQTPQIDYEKLSSIIAGKQSVAEETVLKNYFKQQGLSKEEMEQAINVYKEQREANKPDVESLQRKVETTQQAMIRSQIENKALLMHQELGVEIGAVSYLMKLVDLNGVVDQTGIINDEKLKEAFNKVLTDVPQLKKAEDQNTQGFRQVGAGQTSGDAPASAQSAVATKRWNRFNN